MKGLVPVTKANLASILTECIQVIRSDYNDKVQNFINIYIEKEIKRSKTRKWYRLWLLPKLRFNLTDNGTIEYYNSLSYGIFEQSPFKTLKATKECSIEWVMGLMQICENTKAGDPIQIDIDTFKRISNPERYRWVSTDIFFGI